MRKGDWIQTYSGLMFWPLDPHPDDICIEDIAHSLSMQCRYGGHCLKFYSVAEHSVLVSQFCGLWGLLHDAAEAYLVDLPSPIKSSIPKYRRYEDKLCEVIASKFGLAWPMPQSVKDIDYRILADEKKVLMVDGPAWGRMGEPLGIKIQNWTPMRAKIAFLNRFYDLDTHSI